jgi:hypothetical protein
VHFTLPLALLLAALEDFLTCAVCLPVVGMPLAVLPATVTPVVLLAVSKVSPFSLTATKLMF